MCDVEYRSHLVLGWTVLILWILLVIWCGMIDWVVVFYSVCEEGRSKGFGLDKVPQMSLMNVWCWKNEMNRQNVGCAN